MRGTGLKRRILGSLLDSAIAHHGACFGVIPRPNESQILALVDPSDRWVDGNPRRRIFGDEDGFLSLSRRHRLELLSMDGATVVSHTGRILTAGAIIHVPSGSEGGGRTAALKEIPKYGMGIKVSQDGPIKAYKSVDGEVVEHFAIG